MANNEIKKELLTYKAGDIKVEAYTKKEAIEKLKEMNVSQKVIAATRLV